MSKQFNRVLDAATDQTNVETDWSGIMECIDLIRGKEVSTKDATAAIVKRLKNTNPHVVHHALVLLEACMKNCGSNFHREIISRKFLEELTEIIQANAPNSEVTKKLLEMIQIWNTAFGSKAQFTAIKDIHSILKVSGYQFPAVKESDHMFVAECAPDWVDGNQCFRCRAEFSFFKRKHHCRSCGQIFCDPCSNRQMYLPQFGIEKNVRVCENCFEKTASKQMAILNANKEEAAGKLDEAAERKREKEMADKFEEDLQLALALSKSEAENYVASTRTGETRKLYDMDNTRQNSSKYVDEWVDNSLSGNRSQQLNATVSEDNSIYRGAQAPSLSSVNSDQDQFSDIGIDTALAKYLDRDYWEKKGDGNVLDPIQPQASAPYSGSDTMSVRHQTITPVPLQNEFSALKINSNDSDIDETKQFTTSISELVEMMDNRIRSNMLRGRNIVNDGSIHKLFQQLTGSLINIAERQQKLEVERTEYEQLQDQLGNIQDARQAIDTLRQEHERRQQERLLAEQRQRQAQMQHTLAMMRWQKKNTLNYQREKALERFKEYEKMKANRYAQPSPMAGGMYDNYQPPGYPQNFLSQQQAQQNGVPNEPVYDPQQSRVPEMSSQQAYQQNFHPQQAPNYHPDLMFQQQQVPRHFMAPNSPYMDMSMMNQNSQRQQIAPEQQHQAQHGGEPVYDPQQFRAPEMNLQQTFQQQAQNFPPQQPQNYRPDPMFQQQHQGPRQFMAPPPPHSDMSLMNQNSQRQQMTPEQQQQMHPAQQNFM